MNQRIENELRSLLNELRGQGLSESGLIAACLERDGIKPDRLWGNRRLMIPVMFLTGICTCLLFLTVLRFGAEPSITTERDWLWKSHGLLLALTEDDESFLSKDGTWEFFKSVAPRRRIEGFIQIACDEHHPNLSKWIRAKEPELYLTSSKRHQENKLDFMYAVFWDDTNYLDKVDYANLPYPWLDHYQALLTRLKETGATNVLDRLEKQQEGKGKIGAK